MEKYEEPQVVDADQEAAAIINRNVEEAPDGESSPEQLQDAIEEDIENVKGPTRTKVEQYLTGMKDATEGTQIEELEEGVGGLYDGKKRKIAKSTLTVRESIASTIAQAEETGDHEAHHAENDHLAPVETAATAESPEYLHLGGYVFKDDEPVIEGTTVEATGDTFVSDDYRAKKTTIISAAAAAGISMERVHDALDNKKDLTTIDDRTRAEPQFDMAL